MITRPKISRNEWKPTEIRAFEVGNFAPFSCPVPDHVHVVDGDLEGVLGVEDVLDAVAVLLLLRLISNFVGLAGAKIGRTNS